MRKLVGSLGVLLFIAAFAGGVVGYMVLSVDAETNNVRDGFGRPLAASPFFMQMIFGQERLWAGWFWFVADLVIFWGTIYAGFVLAGWGFRENDAPVDS